MEISSQNNIITPLNSVEPVSVQSAHSSVTAPVQTAAQQDVANLNFGQALSGDDVRSDRVQALQGQIASGTYQVSAQGVAGKLLSSMVEQS
jgi:flagellar biosynthesis anti-sigma factor FlgM